MDSPLNKAGFLQVYINTHDNQLIRVNPETKIPRTYARFAGMMAQLLEKQKIKIVISFLCIV
jgi:rRNA small subunit pseudouridine methyltransferase Nep1